ncbi:uncharacterized protein [Diadema setosum]|uniref:uncharacterized protein n=1 Tax=Diadema setosum TaxID=31175 RepID=UPI003B3B2479
MAKCMEELDALFEEAWNRIPCYIGQCSDDFLSSRGYQPTPCSQDANTEPTEQTARAEENSSSLGKARTEADYGVSTQTTLQDVIDTDRSSIARDIDTSSSQTVGTGVKVECSEVQEFGEIKEEFDVFEVKYEQGDVLSDFYAEQRNSLDISAIMSKSASQHQTTKNDERTTSSAHLVSSNKNPVSDKEQCVPTEAREEIGSTAGGHWDIDTIVRTHPHLNDDHGSIDFYRGLKNYQSRGKFTDVCVDEVRDKVERVVIDRHTYYRCKLCQKTFYELVPIIKHARSHARGKHLFCDQCGRKFRGKFSYDIHLRLHAQGQWREIPDPGSRLYTCQKCHKFFPTNALLSFHKMTHKEEFPFRCGVCDKRFRDSKLRMMHENTHQIVKKKLACPVCGKALSSTATLNTHMKIHKYYKADIEAYACDKCPETFVSAAKLQSHLKTCHPPRPFTETCEKCGRSFSHPTILQQHQRSCHTEKPTTFPCKVCGKEFGRKELVWRHIKIHSDARPYKCLHCDMAFKQSDARHRHEMLHFKDGEFRDVKQHTWKVSHGKDGRQLR